MMGIFCIITSIANYGTIMNASFLNIIFFLTAISGVIILIDKYFWRKNRLAAGDKKEPKGVELSRSLFPVFFVVLIIRSFIVQLFVVPTGSLAPTIMPKAFIVVNQFAYGLRLPVTESKFIPTGHPKRGDIVVFHSPVQPRKDLIKRVIGLPGDQVSYVDKVFYINGKKATQKFIGYTTYGDGDGPKWTVKIMQENLLGVKHNIYVCPKSSTACPGARMNIDFKNLVVPKGEYLMVGDNRDDSDDGRFWGFVPERDIMGKGWRVLFSWNSATNSFRSQQFFKRL